MNERSRPVDLDPAPRPRAIHEAGYPGFSDARWRGRRDPIEHLCDQAGLDRRV